jgi:Fur family ferric uptake transcriptional regulator
MIASTQTNHPLHDAGHLGAEAEARLAAACGRLREAGLRITQPRIAIINALIQRNQPISIEQIHADLDSKSCDLVTVYRCLGAFEDIGIVRRSFLHNGTSLYQLGDRKVPVYHVVAKDTAEIQALDPATSARLSETIAKVEQELRDKGFENVSHVLEFFAKSSGSTQVTRTRDAQVKTPASL